MARAVTALLCFSTCPDVPTAQRIADALVEARLAACVSVLPGVRSTYRWEGAVERADEIQLLIKTTHEAFPALQARLVELHPYAVPELLAVPTVGLPDYLDWIARETAARPDT
jgi:periplasmic divalent cation tolerance protein